MVQTKIFCDHCGKELNSMTDYPDCDLMSIRSNYAFDLCKDCVDKFDKMIEDFISAAENKEKH